MAKDNSLSTSNESGFAKNLAKGAAGLAVAAGAVALGAALSDQDTRSKLTGKVQDSKDKAQRLSGHLGGEASHRITKAKKHLTPKVHQTKKQVLSGS